MAGKTITMTELKQIIRLRGDGAALLTIAEAVKISRNTVKKYLRLIEVKGLNSQDLLRMDDEALEALLKDPKPLKVSRYQNLCDLFPHFEKELNRTGVTRWILWGEYRLKYPDGYSYSQFCDHFAAWGKSRSGTLHIEQEPADKLFIDYTGKKLSFIDLPTGEVIEVEVYVAVLGFSQLTYVEAMESQRKEDFIHGSENALHYFGGVPRVLVPDNLKSAVNKASKFEAEINRSFLDFANHYGTAVLPARSYKPRDKALVEKAVNIAYSRIFAPIRNDVFYSLTSLNKRIADLLEEHNNQHFQQRPCSRRQLFEEEEKLLLSPLPPDRYEIKSFKQVTVMRNGHVQIIEDKHYYSVPYRFIGKKVKLIYSRSQVSVYYNNERIAYHLRSALRYRYTTVKDHLSSAHQFVSEWNPDKFINWAGGIAPVVKAYILEILNNAAYPEQAYRSCVGILSQEKKVGRERFIKTIERATHYGAFNYSTIIKILQAGLDNLDPVEEQVTRNPLPFHENIRGPKNYK
jgi:transposase